MKKILFITLVLLLASCQSSTSKKEKVSGGAKVVEYRPPTKRGFKLRPYTMKQLPNGLKILMIEDQSLPRVSISAFFKVGNLQEKTELSGLNSLTAELAALYGTSQKNREQLHEELDKLGIDLSYASGYDSTWITASALSNQTESLIDIFSEILQAPRFEAKNFESLRKKRIAEYIQSKDDSEVYANDQFDQFLFGNSAYGRRVEGEPVSLKKIKHSDLVKHYLKYYRPNNCVMAIVGYVSEAQVLKIEEKLKSWSARTTDEPVQVPNIVTFDKKIRLIHKPGLSQAQVRIGHLGVARNNPDYLKIRLANFVLGGSFVSRLNSRIRDELGLTYGAGSSFDYRLYPSQFVIDTYSRNDKLRETLKEALQVYQNFYDKGITEAELAAAKKQMKGQFPLAIETVDKLAYQLMTLDYYGVDTSYLQDLPELVDRIKLDEVNATIKNYFSPVQARILVYGDQAKVKTQLAEIAPVEVK